jgi:hypothetical protein
LIVCPGPVVPTVPVDESAVEPVEASVPDLLNVDAAVMPGPTAAGAAALPADAADRVGDEVADEVADEVGDGAAAALLDEPDALADGEALGPAGATWAEATPRPTGPSTSATADPMVPSATVSADTARGLCPGRKSCEGRKFGRAADIVFSNRSRTGRVTHPGSRTGGPLVGRLRSVHAPEGSCRSMADRSTDISVVRRALFDFLLWNSAP